MQQAFDADILVNVGPMNTLPSPDQTKVRSLCGSSFGQSPGPSQWDADDPPVGEIRIDLVLSNAHA
jgi:hypothetical protein